MNPFRVSCPSELTQDTGEAVWEQLASQPGGEGSRWVLDLSGTRFMDSRGGAWIIRLADLARERNAELCLEGQQGQVAGLLDLIAPGLQGSKATKPPSEGFFERVGAAAYQTVSEGREILDLVVEGVYWVVIAPFEGRGFRFSLFMDELYEMGVRAIKITLLMNFLLGLTIAMMSAAQLRSFGLDIFVADLVMIAFARELAAIMTGVVVSARTGAAIAAELANMKVQEEIDALRGMGLSVPQFLIAPKLLALCVAMPCLTAMGMIAGILGGAVWGNLVLEHQLSIWFDHTIKAGQINDISQGLLKSLFFAIVIVLVGCHNGLRVKGGSRGVGLMTTRAVVMDIFAIVVIDMLFATMFYYILG